MTTWCHAKEALWRRSGLRVLVDVPSRGVPLLLEGPAALAWTELSQPTAEEALVRTLAARFNVSTEVVAAELPAVLDELERAGALSCR